MIGSRLVYCRTDKENGDRGADREVRWGHEEWRSRPLSQECTEMQSPTSVAVETKYQAENSNRSARAAWSCNMPTRESTLQVFRFFCVFLLAAQQGGSSRRGHACTWVALIPSILARVKEFCHSCRTWLSICLSFVKVSEYLHLGVKVD